MPSFKGKPRLALLVLGLNQLMLVKSQKVVHLGHHWTQDLNGGIWGLLNLWGMPRSGSLFLVPGALSSWD